MPKISNKGIQMPASPIRKLAPYANQAKLEGKIVYHLNIGQPDIETPEVMLKAASNVPFKVWAYAPSEGLLSCRQKLAGYYQKLAYPVTTEDIIITQGGSEGFIIAMQACLDEGDEIIIPEPFYTNYNGFACIGGITIKPVPSSIENSFGLPPISAFEKLITPKTKAIFICSPNNPTGYVYNRQELENIKRLCLEHDLFLFSDEAYRDFCYDGKEFLSPMHLGGLDKHLIVIDSLSKRYSACGARIGMIVSKNQEVMATSLKFAQARLSAELIAQIAAEAAIDTPMTYFQAALKEYKERRNILVAALNNMQGVLCPMPTGAFYTLARLPVDDTEAFCQWLLEKFSYKGQTLMLAPAAGFYSTPGLGKNEVRLAYVINKEDLKKAMVCLEKALQEYPGRVS